MLLIQLFRAMKGHFSPKDCFGFEASSWYWHFVDVVWVGLFIFVYVLSDPVKKGRMPLFLLQPGVLLCR